MFKFLPLHLSPCQIRLTEPSLLGRSSQNVRFNIFNSGSKVDKMLFFFSVATPWGFSTLLKSFPRLLTYFCSGKYAPWNSSILLSFQCILLLPLSNQTTWMTSSFGFLLAYLAWDTMCNLQKIVMFHHKCLSTKVDEICKVLKVLNMLLFSHSLFNSMMKTVSRHEGVSRLKVFNCDFICCSICAIYFTNQDSIKKPILILARAIVSPRYKIIDIVILV